MGVAGTREAMEKARSVQKITVIMSFILLFVRFIALGVSAGWSSFMLKSGIC